MKQSRFKVHIQRPATSINARVRLNAEPDRANQYIILLEIILPGEESRIKNTRMAQITPHRRPHYPPTKRMAILEIKAARGWSLEQTAEDFQVTAATTAS